MRNTIFQRTKILPISQPMLIHQASQANSKHPQTDESTFILQQTIYSRD